MNGATSASEATGQTGSRSPGRSQRMLLFAAWLHLLLPTFILTDIVTSKLQGEIRITLINGAVAGVCSLWIVAGLAVLTIVPRDILARKIETPLLCFYTVSLMLILGEGALRLSGTVKPDSLLHPAGLKTVTTMDPAIYPGISGRKTFTINDLGLRGPLPPPQGRAYRIVAIGGSTTICVNLDDSEEWPHLVMTDMNGSPNAMPVWVGNAGFNGFNSVHHLVLMQSLPDIVKTDMVVFLLGVNDLQATLAFNGAPTQTILEKDAGYRPLPAGTLWRTRKPAYPRYKRLKLLVLIQRASQNAAHLFGPPRSLRSVDLVALRNRRAAGPSAPMPDLSTGLAEYRSRLASLAARCGQLSLRCLFLTQPTMWRDDVKPAEERLFWAGNIGPIEHPAAFVSTRDLAKAMDQYNQVLLDLCRQSGLECFDLAARIPKDTSAFFDDMHYNENGARIVARELTQYLLSTRPFARDH